MYLLCLYNDVFSIVVLKNELLGAREKAHWVKCLPCQNKNSCLDFGSLTIIPVLSDKHSIPLRKLACQKSQIGKLRVQERSPALIYKVRIQKNYTQHHILSSTHEYTCACSPILGVPIHIPTCISHIYTIVKIQIPSKIRFSLRVTGNIGPCKSSYAGINRQFQLEC